MHKAGFSTNSVGRIIGHCTRERYDDGKYIEYPPSEGGGHIDPSRTWMNYTIGECHDKDWVFERLQDVYSRPQDSSKPKMIDIVLTLPKDEPIENAKAFFEAGYDSLCKQFGRTNKEGKSNLVGAWVHMDEAQPHMHFAFLPVTEKSLKGRPNIKEGISQKAYFRGKSSLQAMHKRTMQDVSSALGHRVSILNGATMGRKPRNKSISELRTESDMAIEKASRMDKGIDTIKESVEKVNPIFGDAYIKMPPDAYKSLLKYARAGAKYVAVSHDKDEETRGLKALLSRTEKERDNAEKELEFLRDESNAYLRVPAFMRDTIDNDIEYRRNEYRDYADSVNRTVCKLFLDNNKDFRATVKAAGPLLDSIGIPKDEHSNYVKSCLRAVAKQAKAKSQHIKNPKREYIAPVHGTGWQPKARETDYDVQEPRPPVAPPPPAQGGDMLSIDKDWNLLTEFEKEELETKAMLRDI